MVRHTKITIFTRFRHISAKKCYICRQTPERESIMVITLIQADLQWADPAANRSHLEALVRATGKTDLIVLPEMFSTGFVTRPEGIAESDDSESLALMRRLAAEKDCGVAGSLAIRETATGRYRNRFYFVFPDGSERHYDKHHLFTYSGEDRQYTAGQERVVIDFRGFRILLQVCYDLRFPVFARNRAAGDGADYDLILYVASWPESRIAAWDPLLRARAIENQCYVAGVNRVGSDPGNRYPGHSILADPWGNPVTICKENQEDIINVELNRFSLDEYRKAFPVLQDADNK